MRPSYFVQNPILFQGESFLNNLDSNEYFEGWYFKHTTPYFNIAFIPGIHISKEKRFAFIQIITPHSSYYATYDISQFHYKNSPFSVQIGNNYFSEHFLSLDIQLPEEQFCLTGHLCYGSFHNISSSAFSPNIMGPFSYFSSMECQHAILSMKHTVNGSLTMNGLVYSFEEGIGYLEKDWGTSFPSSYTWLQGNDFSDPTTSLFFSIATIPFARTHFNGYIASFFLQGKEYRFATYGSSQLKSCFTGNNKIEIALKKGPYLLTILSEKVDKKSQALLAPMKGGMNRPVLESITAQLQVTLLKNGHILYTDHSPNSGLELALP